LFVRTQGDLDLLHAAGREAAHYADRIPGAGFYESKLSTAWARARDTAAYHHLGEFDRESFRRLPMTRRSSLREHPSRYLRIGLNGAAVYYETGGARPLSLPMPRTVEEILWEVATLARAWGHVLRREERVAVAVPSDVSPAADLVVRVCEIAGAVYARAYPLVDGACDWDRMLALWQSLRPTVVAVTPRIAAELTEVVRTRRAARSVGQVRRLLLLGGNSTPALRGWLADSWSVEVFEAGELAEIGPVAASCERHALHLLTSAYFIEVGRGDAALPLEAADRGRLVVTPLNWYGRALLRYDTGQNVLLGQGCECGRLTPTVELCGSGQDSH
jgi:phenylacetate-CoA ligase